jgi:hypothetical protein
MSVTVGGKLKMTAVAVGEAAESLRKAAFYNLHQQYNRKPNSVIKG